MTGLDVPEQDRLAEAVVRGLGEGARASDGTAAIVKPISRDVPVGNLGHVDLRHDKTMLTRLYSQRHVSAAHPAMFSLGSKAKRAGSAYQNGTSRAWLKTKNSKFVRT